MGYHRHFPLLGCTKWVESPPNGCKNNFLEWKIEIKCFHVSTRRFCREGTITQGCKLVKSFYDMKQAPWAWYEKLTEHLLKLNFKHYNLDDTTLFVKEVGRSVVFLVVYLGDFLMKWNNQIYIASIKKDLKKCFEMNDLGHLHYYLGIEVTQHLKYIFISQKKSILGNCWTDFAWQNATLS